VLSAMNHFAEDFESRDFEAKKAKATT
jgi:hypothetical protein